MPDVIYAAFRNEISSLRTIILQLPGKTVRDDLLRERIQSLNVTWLVTVKPQIEPFIREKRYFLKLDQELEKIAQLTSRYKQKSEYARRLNNAYRLSGAIVLYYPNLVVSAVHTHSTLSQTLFLPEIPDLPFSLVPNSIVGWKSNIQSFLARYPFDKSVFIMIRYRNRNANLITTMKHVLDQHGFHGILASDHNLTDDLYNPVACLLCCSRGIAVFDEPETSQEFNPNVAYELGMLTLLGRNLLILKHVSLKELHTDILMKLYQPYKSHDELRSVIKRWIKPKGV